ncbi:polysaccharide biosynthesis tyrosine autokinase [Nitrospinota bacterium]
MGQYDINLRDYWRIIRRRKTIIIFTTVALSFFSYVFAKLNEPAPIYSASSAIRIDRNTAVAGIVGDSSLGQFQEISTQTAVIRSYPVMEAVSKNLGLIDKSLTSEQIAKNSRLVSIINGLAGQVSSEQVGETNIISITVTSGDPDQAARMANTIASVFRKFDFETRNQAVLKQFRFIKSQLDNSEERLRTSEKRIKEFKENRNFLSLSVEATTVTRSLQRLAARVAEFRKAQKRIRDAIQQVRSIGEFQAGKTKRIPVDDIESGLGPLNKQLVQLQVQRDTLLENFTSEHPSVIAVNAQIKSVIREMLLVLEGRERAINTELQSQEKELAILEGRNKTIPDISVQLQRLERQLATDMEVHNLLRQKIEEVNIKLAGRQNLVYIVKPAFRPTSRDNPPQITVNTTLGAILGLIVGLAFALVVETMDTSIGAIEDVESFLEVPVLGVIPILDAEELERQYLESNPDREGRFSADIYGRLVTHFVPRSPVAEAYRSFRTQMEFLSLEKEGNIFLVTSSAPGEGKTTTSINLAITYAQTNKRTLLIDSDMRKPTIYRIFGIDREPGVTDILLGNYNWEECIRTMTDIMLGKFDMEDIMLTPGLDNLNILTTGNIPPNPSELLNSPRMTEFLENLRQEFDIIILDTPPLLPVTDAAVLGTKVDGCVLVYRVGTIARGALKRAKLQLDNVRANVWGIVLNSMRPEASTDLDAFRYQSSYYYGGYVEEAAEENLADLPIYARLYRQARNVIFPGRHEDAQEEASPLAKAIGAVFVALSLGAIGSGMAWQAGVSLPAVGSLNESYQQIGRPPGGMLQDLDETWKNAHQENPQPAPTSGEPQAPGTEGSPPPAGRISEGKPPPVETGGVFREKVQDTKAEKGAFWRPQKPRASIALASGPGETQEHPPPTAEQRRAALRGANLNKPLPPRKANSGMAPAERAPKRPFSIVYSVNQFSETTRRQFAQLHEVDLSPSFAPVQYSGGGTMDRVFIGSFTTKNEALTFMKKHVLPLAPGRSGPIVQKLPYALQIAEDMSAQEAEVVRVILKAVGLQTYFEDDAGRMLLGAFKSPRESRAAADILAKENIPFRIVTR